MPPPSSTVLLHSLGNWRFLQSLPILTSADKTAWRLSYSIHRKPGPQHPMQPGPCVQECYLQALWCYIWSGLLCSALYNPRGLWPSFVPAWNTPFLALVKIFSFNFYSLSPAHLYQLFLTNLASSFLYIYSS